MKKLLTKKYIQPFLLGLLVVVGVSTVSATPFAIPTGIIPPASDVTGIVTTDIIQQAINVTPAFPLDMTALLTIKGLFLVNDNFSVWNDTIISIPQGAGQLTASSPVVPSLTGNGTGYINRTGYADPAKGLFTSSLSTTAVPKEVCADVSGKLIFCDGVCGTATNTCTLGTVNDIPDSATAALWQCQGISNGATASCQSPITAGALVSCGTVPAMFDFSSLAVPCWFGTMVPGGNYALGGSWQCQDSVIPTTVISCGDTSSGCALNPWNPSCWNFNIGNIGFIGALNT